MNRWSSRVCDAVTCPSGMDFPVDVLGSVSHEALEQEAQAYMTDLRYVSLDKAQSFTLNNHRKVWARTHTHTHTRIQSLSVLFC